MTEALGSFVVVFTGLWTDNGAYYYYQTEEGMNYEETLLEMDRRVREMGLPVRYMNVSRFLVDLSLMKIAVFFKIDSWWYHKGLDFGVKNWTEIPELFPDIGLAGIRDATGWPFVAHNRYWAIGERKLLQPFRDRH